MDALVSARAAIFEPGACEAVVTDVVLGPLRDDEVLVRVVAAGVCHTDLGYRGRLEYPVVLGHEGAGVVERVGANVVKVAPGDAVVLSFMSCGHCRNCARRAPSYCESMQRLNQTGFRSDGTTAMRRCGGGDVGGHFFGQSSFASYSVANVRNVVKAPESAPLHVLGPLGCGVQTGAGAVMNVLKPRPEKSLLIVGAGGVGLSAAVAGAAIGCAPIIVAEPHAGRRATALAVGASHAIDPKAENLVERVRNIAPRGVDHAVDTSGVPGAIAAALEALGSRGAMALVTTSPRDAVASFPILGFLRRGVRLHGVIEGDSDPNSFIPQLIEVMLDGRLPVEKLTRTYALQDINQALADQASGAVIKPIIRMSH